MKNFFVFLKNKIIEAVTGRRPYEEEFDEGEKGYQVIFLFFTKKRKDIRSFFFLFFFTKSNEIINLDISILSVDIALIQLIQ